MLNILRVGCIGHRVVKLNNMQIEKLKKLILELIRIRNVRIFNFGSRSKFDELCHQIVTEIKKENVELKRVCYYTNCEAPWLEDEVLEFEKKHPNLAKPYSRAFEEKYCHDEVLNAGKSAYIRRNQEIINNSDILIFYYNDNYLPNKRKKSRRDLNLYQLNSGTKIALEYALKKNKEVIIIDDNF